MATELDTTIVFTSRMHEMAAFYAAGLELTDPQEEPRHIGYQVGTMYLGFDQVDLPTSGPSAVTLWFRVDDLENVFNRFVRLGAAVIYPPQEKPWGDRLACVRDFDGNRIGLSQRR